MNATSATATQGGGSARAIGIVLIVVIAAVAGLAVGTFIQQSGDDQSAAGAGAGATYYWPEEPLNHHTPSSFERPDAANWPDYGLRLRLGAVTGDSSDMGLPLHITNPFPGGASDSDTFRLTGPSRTGNNVNQGENEPVQLRRQPN